MSETGRLRQRNQDNLLMDESIGLLMVGDGLGGHTDGDIASSSALNDIHRLILRHGARLLTDEHDADATVDHRHSPFFPRCPDHTEQSATADPFIEQALEVVERALTWANAHLNARNRGRGLPEGKGMGTTVTGVWRPGRDAAMVVFHVGDSRLYQWRAGTLRQLTTDHSLARSNPGYTGRRSDSRHPLWQALGPSSAVSPQVQAVHPQPGDVYLLCTDGLHGMAEDGEIAAVLAKAARETLPQACASLIALANRRGGRDNVTALLMWCDR